MASLRFSVDAPLMPIIKCIRYSSSSERLFLVTSDTTVHAKMYCQTMYCQTMYCQTMYCQCTANHRTNSASKLNKKKYSFSLSTPWRNIGGVEVQFHSLTSALDGGQWLTSRSGRFTPGKETRCPLYSRLNGPQGRSGRLRKMSPPPGFDYHIHMLLFLLCYVKCRLTSLT